MAVRVAYFYFMKGSPDNVREAVPAHVDYWKGQALAKYTGGPFADRSGGLISFEASSMTEALSIIEKDPIVLKDLIGQSWAKEWLPQH